MADADIKEIIEMMRCAIIGCGRNVEDLHLSALKGIKGLEVTAACDLDHMRLNTFGEKYGIKNLFNNFEAFLESNIKVDFLDISTPGFTHYELCREALEAGYNLLVEKPITLSLKQTIELKKISDKKNIKVCVIQNYRYKNVTLKAKKDIERGRVGKINQVNVTFHGQSVFNEPAPWLWEERKNKSLLYEICLHYLDLEIYFAGKVTDIIGIKSSWNKDLNSTEKVYALVEHENGAIGIIDLQFNASSNYTHVELFGSANDILIKFFPEYYRIYSGNINPIDEVYYDCKRIADFAIPTIKERLLKKNVNKRAMSHYRLFKFFTDSLKNEKCKVPVSLDDVLPTMELAEELSKAVY